MTPPSAPHISVVIPTCNRPEDMRRCLASLAHVAYPDWDVVIIDQSDGDQTRAVADDYRTSLPALAYLHLDEKGISRARNKGVAEARGELIAFLDDDCTIGADWLRQIAHAFTRYPRAGLVYGTVEPGPYDPDESFVIVHEMRKEHVARGRVGVLRLGGIGASMYVRRAAMSRIGPFDLYLGAGSGFFSSTDDDDYRYRCLVAGYSVVETPAIVVRHYGMRDYKSGAASRLLRGYAQSNGALHMKLLRCGDLFVLILMVKYASAYLRAINLRNLVLRKGPTRIGQLTMYLRGLGASFRLPVDRRRLLYEQRRDR